MTGMYSAGAMALMKIYQGQQQRVALQGASNELNMEAGQSVAAGIQRGIMERRKTDYVASNANAEIAAGGLATTGTSAQAVVGQIKGQGEYNARTALYEGAQRSNELNYDASLRRNKAKAAATASYFSAASSLISGGSDFYSKYGADTSPVGYRPGDAGAYVSYGVARPNDTYASDYGGALA